MHCRSCCVLGNGRVRSDPTVKNVDRPLGQLEHGRQLGSRRHPIAGDRVIIAPNDGTARTITYDYAGVPVALEGMTIDLVGGDPASRTTFSMSENDLTIDGFFLGFNGRAIFNQSGGTVTANATRFDSTLGEVANSHGIYNLSGTAALSIAPICTLGIKASVP